MSFRNAPFYSFPHEISPDIRFNMKWSCHFYCIFTEIGVFFTGILSYRYLIKLYIFVRAFSKHKEKNIFTISLYLFLICWMFARLGCESVFSKQKVVVCVFLLSVSSLFLSAAIFQLFFRWRRNCSNLLMQAKRNNLWEKIFLLENQPFCRTSALLEP